MRRIWLILPAVAGLAPVHPLARAPTRHAAVVPTMRLDFGQPEFDEDEHEQPPPAPPPPPPPPPPVQAAGPPPAAAPAEVRAAEAAALAAWVTQSGGSTAGVAPVPTKFGDGSCIGLAATQGARRGDVLLSVPLSLGLSAESALRSSIGPYIAEFEPYLADYAFIALALIHERRLGEQSDLAPWLCGSQSLLPPAGFADLPLLWGEDELSELEAATTAGAPERVADVREDFEWLRDNIFAAAPEIFPPEVRSAPLRLSLWLRAFADSRLHLPRGLRRSSRTLPTWQEWRSLSRVHFPSTRAVMEMGQLTHRQSTSLWRCCGDFRSVRAQGV